MRPSLLNPRSRRRPSRRQPHQHAPRALEPIPQACDPAVERVRQAGGPIDRASYACACGYMFRASVSTSVSCPHCGADQAW
jgi:hypothetical protein